MDDEELGRLADAFVTASRALVGIAIRSVEAAPVPVTVPQHRVLVLLSQEPQPVGRLAEQLGVNPSNATRVCDRLQRLDLVTRTPSPADGRGVEVSITPAGRQVVDAVTAHRRAELLAILRRLQAGQLRAAVSAVVAFSDAADEHAELSPSP